MTTQVRLFAGLREAAGVSNMTTDAPDLASLLDELRERFGEPFAGRLEASSVVVDGDPTPQDADVALDEVEEVALLPPVSGG